MGHGWRRVMETVRQKVGADRTFKATSNARNEAMFKEATEFCTQLKALERDLKSTHKEIEGKFASLRSILQSPLPRAYDDGQNGAVPCSDELQIGQGVGVDTLQQAANDLKLRLEDDVIKPLQSWLDVYRRVRDRMEKLEQVRLELDSRRRTVDALGEKLDRMEKTTPQPQYKEKHEQELEKLAQLLQHKRDKLNHTQHAYRDLEQTVFNSLQTLIKDTGVLRDYAGMSLQFIQECYQKAHAAFSTATPLHDYHSTSDNLYQAQFRAPPIMEKAQSERAALIRNMAEQRPQAPRTGGGAKEGERAVAMYAAAMDDVVDQTPYDQQLASPYPDMPPAGAQMPSGMVNPYQGAYQQSPHATRYMTSPPGAWKPQPQY